MQEVSQVSPDTAPGAGKTQPTLNLKFLSHGTLESKDLEFTRKFYEEFFGFVVAAQMPSGRALYRRELTPEEVSHRVGLAHAPFHQALDAVIARLLERFPRVLLLDLHSFGKEADGDVILGDRHGVTARPEAMTLLSGALAGGGLSVLHNTRYPGGWTVRRFAAEPRVDAIQIELNQRCYLDLTRRRYPDPPPAGDFEETQRQLRGVLADGIVGPLTARYAP